MNTSKPILGIDFGTSTSSMAWFNPATQRAEVIKNWEEHEWTPSVVYFGEAEILVGEPALQMLEDDEECKRVILSPKRHLASNSHLPLPGKKLKAVDAAAEILRKLKMDAERLHFHEPVKRAVITYPASFSTLERDMVSKAGTLAGFEELVLIEEPVAAALAYAREGLNVGQYILVYDLGGGTFDVALLENEQGVFRINQTPRGIPNLGGDDFDRALYIYCEEIINQRMHRPIDPEGENKAFLLLCRTNKESLSTNEHSRIATYLQGVLFEEMIDRKAFESMIQVDVDRTVRLTQELIAESKENGKVVDTIVLIGGSSKIPLVMRKLGATLPVEPKEWQHRGVAVALGAAYYAAEIWPTNPPDHHGENGADKFCTKCGYPNSGKLNFCIKCGNHIASNRKICHSCGVENMENMRFCVKCGALL
jgi:molecular chaperone DnaK